MCTVKKPQLYLRKQLEVFVTATSDIWQHIVTSHWINHSSRISNKNNMVVGRARLATESQACYKSTFKCKSHK